MRMPSWIRRFKLYFTEAFMRCTSGQTLMRWTVFSIAASVALAIHPAFARQGFACETPRVVPLEMGVKGRYLASDKSHSRFDPEMVSSQEEVRRRVTYPVSKIVSMADAYRATSDPLRKADISRCLLAHFLSLQQTNALLQPKSDSDHHFATWMTAALSIAFMKADDSFPGGSEVDRIKAYLVKMSNLVRQFYVSRNMNRVNNLQYWGGLSVGAAGLAVGDCTMIAYARTVLKNGLGDIDVDGLLPEELRRGERARHYHLFAAEALASLAELTAMPLSTGERQAMARLSWAIVTSHKGDGGLIQRRSGVSQAQDKDMTGLLLLKPFLGADRKAASLADALVSKARGSIFFLGGDVRYILEYRSSAEGKRVHRNCPMPTS